MKGIKAAIICLTGFMVITFVPSMSSPSYAAKGEGFVCLLRHLRHCRQHRRRLLPIRIRARKVRELQGPRVRQASLKPIHRQALQAKTNQTGSAWGGTMRNIGLLAGGMFLGSMLSSLLDGKYGIYGRYFGCFVQCRTGNGRRIAGDEPLAKIQKSSFVFTQRQLPTGADMKKR